MNLTLIVQSITQAMSSPPQAAGRAQASTCLWSVNFLVAPGQTANGSLIVQYTSAPGFNCGDSVNIALPVAPSGADTKGPLPAKK